MQWECTMRKKRPVPKIVNIGPEYAWLSRPSTGVIAIALNVSEDGFAYQYRGILVIVSDAWRVCICCFANRNIEGCARFSLRFPWFAKINACSFSLFGRQRVMVRAPYYAKQTCSS